MSVNDIAHAELGITLIRPALTGTRYLKHGRRIWSVCHHYRLCDVSKQPWGWCSAEGLPVYCTSCARCASARLECATSRNHAIRYKITRNRSGQCLETPAFRASSFRSPPGEVCFGGVLIPALCRESDLERYTPQMVISGSFEWTSQLVVNTFWTQDLTKHSKK